MVGVLAVVCLGTALALWLTNSGGRQSDLWLAAFLRVGILLCALWLALPTKSRDAAWANVSPLTFAGLLLLLAGLARPIFRIFLPLGIVLIILGLLKRKPRSRRGRG